MISASSPYWPHATCFLDMPWRQRGQRLAGFQPTVEVHDQAVCQRGDGGDVSLPEGMKRSMSRQAEAERERRARIITADGQYQASKRLAAAANVMARDPGALQLRLLQTVVEVAAVGNRTLVMPVPVELLRFFDKFTPPAPAGASRPAADSAVTRGLRRPGYGRSRDRKRSDAGDTRGPAHSPAAHPGEQRQAGRRHRKADAGRSGPAQRRRHGPGRVGRSRLSCPSITRLG
jgi:hypothetical protein